MIAASGSDLPARAVTAAIALPIVVALAVSPWPSAWALAVAAAVAVVGWECMTLLTRGRHRAAIVAGSLLAATTAAALYALDPSRAIAVTSGLLGCGVVALGILALALVLIHTPRHRSVVSTAMALLLTTLVAGVLLGQLALLRRDAGPLWVLLALAVSWGGDAAAYFVGRTLGGPRLAPKVSPAKTVAGAIAGLLVAAAAGPIVLLVGPPGLDPTRVVVVTLVAGVLSQVGDLAESFLKRTCDAKDSGRVLPGHGGMLDCLDGMCLVAPWCYFASQYVTR